MKASKLAAIILIYIATAIAWMILAGTTSYRSSETYKNSMVGYQEGRAGVKQSWGPPQTQIAPNVWTTHLEKVKSLDAKGKPVWQDNKVTDPVVLSKSRLNVKIDLDPRRKGLNWYSTYKVSYAGEYTFSNEFPNERKFFIQFRFPTSETAYDNVEMYINGKRQYAGGDLSNGMVAPVTLKPGEEAVVRISYGSQGLDTWHYQFKDNGTVSSVRDFKAVLAANCTDIDIPENCISSTHREEANNKSKLTWEYGDLISGANVGIALPKRLNPGPFASRLSMFAPVSLLFFFAVLLIVGAVRNIRLHPVHYLMLAASFFSFHLLFSYLVDHVPPFYSFLIASAVSMILTISYLRLVVNWKFATFTGGVWQFIFLVLFAYAFFFEGYTGLTITIGAIVTLAVLMQMTGRVNWDEALSGNGSTKPPAT